MPSPPKDCDYHIFLDNLFVSTRFIQYARFQGVGVTGTCRDTGGINKKLLKLKKKDNKDVISWGETYLIPTPNSQVCYIGWKDQAFILMMSSVLSADEKVIRLRRRLKETSSKAKTSRIPFGEDAIKELSIPIIADEYNYHIRAVDEFDHLTTQNPGLRRVRRGGSQALEYWLLRTVLVNCYLLALCSDVPEPRQVSFRSQQDFRKQLVGALLAMAKGGSEPCKKRRISVINPDATQEPVSSHTPIKMDKKRLCVSCKGLRFRDRPQKRVALAEIAANSKRPSSRHESWYGYKQCDVHLCKERGCFDAFHK